VRRLATTLTLLALPLAATAGCGGSGPSDAEQVRNVLARFSTATQKRDYATLCNEVLAPKLLSGLQQIGLPCEIALRRSLGSVHNPRMTVGRVTVRGKTASAQVRTSAAGQQPSSDTIQLVKVKGGWRISALGR
jgi:hypothetical protein